MDKNQTRFQLLFILVLLFLIGTALVYSNRRAKNPQTTRVAVKSSGATQMDPLKTQELLDSATDNDWEDEYFTSPNPKQSVSRVPAPTAWRPGQSFSEINSVQEQPSTYERPGEGASSLYGQAAGSLPAGSYAANQSRAGARPGAYGAGSGNFAPVTSSKDDKKPLEMPFSPYMASLTKEQAASLEKQLNGLSDRLEAAILRALLPKSKKDMNVEKYLASTKGEAPSAEDTTAQKNPAAVIAKQMSKQKSGIVNSMKNAFGNKAARQAGQIMDSFQQELTNALSQPGLTQQQIQQQTRQISQKYNKQLQKLSEKSGL
ncbi:MAG: hypothetical protein IKO35_04605 [Elusimicrobiaceae bacterium]|nr:hypothetical protein [Elusimicrobiaceae bacterium]